MKSALFTFVIFIITCCSTVAQSLLLNPLNGPDGCFAWDFQINEQGDILVSAVAGEATHISRDGGITWNETIGPMGSLNMYPTPDGSFYSWGFSFPRLNKIFSGSNNVQNIPIATLDGTNHKHFFVDKEGRFFAVTNGEKLFRSDDEGATWTDLGAVPWGDGSFYFLTMDSPKGGDYLYFITRKIFPNENKLYRVLKSGGLIEEVYDAGFESINNFCYDATLGHFISRNAGVIHSADGSVGSWQPISSGFSVSYISCGPPGTLIAAGLDGYFSATGTNGNWSPLSGNAVANHPEGFKMLYNSSIGRYIIMNLSSETVNLFSVSTDLSDWQPICPYNDRPPISRIFIDGADNIYAGVVRPNEIDIEGWHRSTDGGNTFQPYQLPGNIEIRSITKAANSILIASGYDDNLYRSTDDGTTWTNVQPSGVDLFPQNFTRYSFVKGHSSGTVVSFFENGRNTFWISTDSGLTWTFSDNLSYFEGNVAIDPLGNIFTIPGLSGTSTAIRKYDLNTSQWTNQYVDNNRLFGLEISPTGVIYVGGIFRALSATLISEDGGITFAGSPTSVNNLTAAPNGYLIGSQQAGTILLSKNDALSWELGYQSSHPGTVRDFAFDSNNFLYVAWNNNRIFKSSQFIVNDNYIVGNVFYDADDECDFDSTEVPLNNILLTAIGTDTFYVTNRSDGRFVIPVPAGTYDVSVSLDEDFWIACDPTQTVTLSGVGDTAIVDFPVKANVQCPQMQVDLTNAFLRRCFENTYHVRYCNEGTVEAQNVFTEITLDPRMSILSADLPFTINGNVYTFDLPDLPIFECDRFSFVTEMICDSVDLGETLCMDAKIFPDTVCVPPDPLWNGASIRIDGECIGDTIFFNVENVGTGDMIQSRQYIIIEDQIIEKVSPPFNLPAGGSLPVKVPVQGQTVHMETEQVDNHPGISRPRLTVEKCGSAPYSLGLFNQFGQDDLSGFVDIECREAIGSYDPNDKSAVPVGLGPRHSIQPDESLEYLIRFQNTGTDTAFNIRILDTLSYLLDVTTFEAGASSHDYDYKIFDGGVVQFDFKNIMLPDSNINLAASNGFVKFTISLIPNAPLGETVFNSVAIYFDFNDPIFTNQTFHFIEVPWAQLVPSEEISEVKIDLKVYPNPVKEQAIIELKNASLGQKQFNVFSLSGNVVYSQTFEGQRFIFNRDHLPEGIYFYEIKNGNMKIAVGKLVIQ